MIYILKNIRTFIKLEKMIFLLILLCIVTSSFIINFSYGLYQNYNVIKDEKSSEYKELCITINDSDSVTKDKIKSCVFTLSNKTNKSISMYLVFPIIEPFYGMQDNGWNRVMIRFTAENGIIKPSTAFAQQLEENENMISGEYFTEKQEGNGDLVALTRPPVDPQFKDTMVDITSDITTRIDGEKRWVEIQNKEYEVIGYHKQLATPYFPFESLDDSTTFQDAIYLVFPKSMTNSQFEEIKMNFEGMFGSAITVPDLDIPESESYYLYNTIILISIMIAILAAINFAVLYKYILSKRTKTLAIFRICGCTKSKALVMFLSECMIIAVPFFALTTLIYDKFVLPKLGQHFEYIESAYSPKLYLLIFVIYIVATFVVLLFMISGFLRKTIREAKEEK